MGTVVELWRYPVKSMQGERLSDVEVTSKGVVGDRRFGVVNPDGSLLTAKTEPRLLEATAATRAGEVVVTLPDGTQAAAADATSAVASWLDRDVRVVEVDASVATHYRMTFDPPNDDAEQFEIPAPPGSFVDLAPLHLLTTGALDTCREARPDLTWDVRRFRPNVVIDLPGRFPEDAWVDHRLRIGGVVLGVQMQTVRCAMPLRAQPGLERSADIYRTLTDLGDTRSAPPHNANHLGVYAQVVVPGSISLGDTVEVL
jgi:uncharacterized protein YcbX